MWSIYIKEVPPGSELEYMLGRFPFGGTHNSNNFIFVAVHPNAVDPLVVGDMVDAEGEPLSGNALVWALAQEFNKPQRRAIHLTKAEASVLHRHPAWRICCGEYGENREQFKADWEYIRQLIASAMPSAAGSWPTYSDAITYKQGREALNAAIQEFGD